MKFTLSFAGCGFLGIYHIGVIKAFRDHVPDILKTYIAGSSAGSFAATAAICNIEIGIFMKIILINCNKRQLNLKINNRYH